MPIIAYQSLNSNSSTDHGISASNSQHFTRMTHDQLAMNSDPWNLVLPTAPDISPDIPVQGPAELRSTASSGYMDKGQHSNDSFSSMVANKVRQIYQNLIRAFGGVDLLVCGELDSSHSDWTSMQSNAGQLIHTSSPAKACNCFSVHSTNGTANKFLGEGDGWLAVACHNIIVVFVHVPNSIAKSEDSLMSYYQKINSVVIQVGLGPIDVVMGDTNQPTNDFTARVLSRALGIKFSDAHAGGSINPFDSHQRSFDGTNSTATKKYDVAVYNTTSLKLAEVVYLSQSTPVTGGGRYSAAVTDHMGIGLRIEK